jgi:hypothetical protein
MGRGLQLSAYLLGYSQEVSDLLNSLLVLSTRSFILAYCTITPDCQGNRDFFILGASRVSLTVNYKKGVNEVAQYVPGNWPVDKRNCSTQLHVMRSCALSNCEPSDNSSLLKMYGTRLLNKAQRKSASICLPGLPPSSS